MALATAVLELEYLATYSSGTQNGRPSHSTTAMKYMYGETKK
jgi:hypothetical protein